MKILALVFNKKKVIDGHILAKAKNEKCNRKQSDFLLIVASNYIHLAFFILCMLVQSVQTCFNTSLKIQ